MLILSEFTGAAHELKSSLIVNPHDVDGLVFTMDQALAMSETEQSQRMRALRRVVQRHDVFTWAREFFETLTS